MFKIFSSKSNQTTDSALLLLKRIARLEAKGLTGKIPIEKQVLLILINRMLIDAQSALILSKKGLYGSAYSITAIMLRSYTMYASLVSDKAKLDSFWNEEAETYQNDKVFKKNFSEGEISKIAKTKFGNDAFERNELEKLLHGSCYAIRKYYSKKEVDAEGKRYPVITFERFHEENKGKMINSIIGGIILDFLGVFFTDYQDNGKTEYKIELKFYYSLIDDAKRDNIKYQKELTRQNL